MNKEVPGSSSLPDGIALQLISRSPFSLVLTDPRQDEDPIIYVNDAFEETTGYGRDYAVGRNCRFLQGPRTDPRAVERIRKALKARREIMIDLLNYRADGTPFWNRLLIAPLFDENEELQYFIGVQKRLASAETTDSVDNALREIQHRVKNHLAIVVSLLRLHKRGTDERTVSTLDAVARRVQSLQLLYEELTYRDGQSSDAIELSEYLRRISDSMASFTDGVELSFVPETEPFAVPLETAVHAGMIFSELLTNAVQHAFVGRAQGRIRTVLRETEDFGFELVVRDDGVGLPMDSEWPATGSLGGQLVRQFCDSLDAELQVASTQDGTIITIRFPRSARGDG